MAIVRVYARACELDGRNFNKVPSGLQPQVRAVIEADGYQILPDGTVVPVENVE